MPDDPPADRPPPTEDQIYVVRECASQMEYAFRARPAPGTESRVNWNKHFLTTFSNLLAVLKVTRIKFLPPFAIATIWENNRRSRAGHKELDIDLIGDAYDPRHPAYDPGPRRIIYEPAFDGPFSRIPEEELRNVWWSQRPAQQDMTTPGGAHDDDQSRRDAEGEQGLPLDAGGSAQGTDEDVMEADAPEAEEEIETVVPDAEEHMETDGASDAGQPSDSVPSGRGRRGRSMRGDSTSLHTPRRTRSSSRPLRSAITAPRSRSSSPHAGVERKSMKAKGKAKATKVDSPLHPDHTTAATSNSAGGQESIGAAGKGKRSARSRAPPHAALGGLLTLKDIPPVTIPAKDIPHPRPCERCVQKGRVCMYNPVQRPGCTDCAEERGKCSLSPNTKNHLMATYLSYAWFVMVSSPNIYAPPDFSPTHLPKPLPQKEDIAWFQKQYNAQPRGRPTAGSKKKVRGSSAGSAPGDDMPGVEGYQSDAEGRDAEEQDAGALDAGERDAEDRDAEDEDAEDEDAEDEGAEDEDEDAEQQDAEGESVAGEGDDVQMVTSPAESEEDVPPEPAAAATATGASHATSKGLTDVIRPTGAVGQRQDQGRSASSSHRSDASTAAMSVDDGASPGDDDDVEGMHIVQEPARRQHLGVGGPSRPEALEILRPATKEIHVTRVPHELSLRSSARLAQRPPELPAPPPGTKKYLYVPFAVKPIESWEHLPRLGHRIENGVYMVVGPPHEDNTPKILEKLLEVGRTGLETVDRLDRSKAHPPQPHASRPVTPEAHQFVISGNVIRAAQDTKAKFDEMENLNATITNDGAMLKARAAAIMDRYGPSILESPDAAHAVTEDVRDAFIALARVHEVLGRLSSAFRLVPAVPWNWHALLELLTAIDDLRDLYRIAWERFDVLEEDLRPLRGEMYRLHHSVAHVQAALDGIANETVNACQPLLHNMFDHFATRLGSIEERLRPLDGGPRVVFGPSEPTMGEVLSMITSVSARMDRLESALRDPLKTRIEATIANYLAERGLTEEVIRRLGHDIGEPPAPLEVGGSISDVLHNVYDVPPSTGGHLPAPATSVHRLRTPLDLGDMTSTGAGPSAARDEAVRRSLGSASAAQGRPVRQYTTRREGGATASGPGGGKAR